MFKKAFVIILLILILLTFTGCVPPFVDGGIVATDYFYDKVKITAFEIDANVEGGYTESEVSELTLDDFIDGNEKNIAYGSYYSFVFTTKDEGIALTSLAYIVQSEADCVIRFTVFYGEDKVVADTVSLEENIISTVYFSNLNVVLKKNKELRIIISNPIEVGTVMFRTDSYIFIGQEVENV